jgi:hypothetical protein
MVLIEFEDGQGIVFSEDKKIVNIKEPGPNTKQFDEAMYDMRCHIESFAAHAVTWADVLDNNALKESCEAERFLYRSNYPDPGKKVESMVGGKIVTE